MIGPDWAGDERSGTAEADRPRRVAVVTGSRADYGLLRPVMHAIQTRRDLELLVIASGSHLIQPGLTFYDVKRDFDVADSVPMQVAGKVGRWADVEAVGKGISRFGRSFRAHAPEWVVVLGDRVEAYAAATAASLGGLALAHIHGGDRAEGVADESMRHAITKLAHLHLAATVTSGERIRKMGERPQDVVVVGSPALDGLASVRPIGDKRWAELGAPDAVLLMHPIGRTDEAEEHATSLVLEALEGRRVLALHPNFDPGREGVLRALVNAGDAVHLERHLTRDEFVGVLKRLAEQHADDKPDSRGGVLVGNSSSGLIEAAALGCPTVDIGQRQAGRERAEGLTFWAAEDAEAIRGALDRAAQCDTSDEGGASHPFGDGLAGVRIAEALATHDPHDERRLRKRCAY
ncbi:MAG: UDP-N-acetylglucosamine 2-epimerase [Phycisphaerales bacterium JB040]